jgi:hypothetical protein
MADNGGGKNKKYGRNKPFATRYKMEGRYEKNKRKSLARHLKRMGLPANYLGGYMDPGGKPHPAKSALNA